MHAMAESKQKRSETGICEETCSLCEEICCLGSSLLKVWRIGITFQAYGGTAHEDKEIFHHSKLAGGSYIRNFRRWKHRGHHNKQHNKDNHNNHHVSAVGQTLIA
jgi:hypothetical protein